MKIWLIVGIVLILLGLALFTGMMSVNHWDFRALNTAAYETNRHEITENYNDISIFTDTANVSFAIAADGITRVECYEETNAKHTVSILDGTLLIRLKNEKKWYEYIGVNFDTPKITLYLPAAEYGALSIKGSTGKITVPKDFPFESINVAVSTGDVTCLASASEEIRIDTDTGSIRVDDVHASSLDLSVSTGRIVARSVICDGDVSVHVSTGKAALTDVSCQRLVSNGSTGDLSLTNVIASGDFSIERSTGDVSFDACDAATLSVTTDTGNVTGTLLTDKIFIASTDTGRVSVPKTSLGGKCEITTDTGDIKIEIHK